MMLTSVYDSYKELSGDNGHQSEIHNDHSGVRGHQSEDHPFSGVRGHQSEDHNDHSSEDHNDHSGDNGNQNGVQIPTSEHPETHIN